MADYLHRWHKELIRFEQGIMRHSIGYCYYSLRLRAYACHVELLVKTCLLHVHELPIALTIVHFDGTSMSFLHNIKQIGL